MRDADVSRFSQCGGSARAAGRYAGGGTIAYDILLRAERDFGIHAVSYDDDVHPYTDLVIGRVDAVLLDNVLAERRTMRDGTLERIFRKWRPLPKWRRATDRRGCSQAGRRRGAICPRFCAPR